MIDTSKLLNELLGAAAGGRSGGVLSQVLQGGLQQILQGAASGGGGAPTSRVSPQAGGDGGLGGLGDLGALLGGAGSGGLGGLLGSLLRNAGGASGNVAAAPTEAPGGGGLGGLLDSLTRGAGGSGGAGGLAGAGGLGGLGGLLDSLTRGAGGAQGGAGAGGIGDLLKNLGLGAPGGQADAATPDLSGLNLPGSQPSARDRPDAAAGNAGDHLVKYGGMAVIGMLAYNAFKKWQQQQQQQAPGVALQAPPPASGFHPTEAPGGSDALSLVLLRSMIAAAQADGRIDQDEQRRILGNLEQVGLGGDEREFLLEEFRSPVAVDALVEAATTPQLAAQIFAASAIAINVDTPVERAYLDKLARQLRLDPALAGQIERTVHGT